MRPLFLLLALLLPATAALPRQAGGTAAGRSALNSEPTGALRVIGRKVPAQAGVCAGIRQRTR